MEKTVMKAKEHAAWTRVAGGWRKYDEDLVKAFSPVSDKLLAAAAVTPGGHVLDIASGTGEPAIPAALRVGPTGRVLGTDFVEEMLIFAREKADMRGLTNLEFRTLDGEALDVEDASFDAVTMRWGLMFMPDPVACLTRAYRALKRGGRIALSCWAAPERNPWVTIALGALKRHMDVPAPQPGATGLFAFADPARLRATLEAAGFRDVAVEAVDLRPVDVATGAEYFHWAFELAGPLAALFAQLDQPAQEQVAREVAGDAQQRSVTRERVVLPGTTWVASGVK